MTCPNCKRAATRVRDVTTYSDLPDSVQLWRCDCCGHEWTERIPARPDALYHCDGNCIDCPNWCEKAEVAQ